MRKDLSTNMNRIEKLIWKQFQYELNSRGLLDMSYNPNAFYLRIAPQTSQKGIDKTIATITDKICDKDIEMHILDKRTIMIGSTATPEDAFRWQEAKVNSEMEALLQIQKQVLERKKQLIPSLKALVEAQNNLPPDSELAGKYGKKSFEGLA
jgi:hypothetical protein